MPKLNARAKGARGEREFAEWLRENLGDVKARRGASQGWGGSCRPDVECSLPLHWEIKLVEALNIYKAMDQSIRDCHPNNIPLVAHKKNRSVWHVTLLASDLLRLVDEINQFRARQAENDDSQGDATR